MAELSVCPHTPVEGSLEHLVAPRFQQWRHELILFHNYLWLELQGVDTVYLEPAHLNELKDTAQARALIYQPKSLGWHRLGPESNGNPTWLLLYRDKSKWPGE
jgi:hypothetical protein